MEDNNGFSSFFYILGILTLTAAFFLIIRYYTNYTADIEHNNIQNNYESTSSFTPPQYEKTRGSGYLSFYVDVPDGYYHYKQGDGIRIQNDKLRIISEKYPRQPGIATDFILISELTESSDVYYYDASSFDILEKLEVNDTGFSVEFDENTSQETKEEYMYRRMKDITVDGLTVKVFMNDNPRGSPDIVGELLYQTTHDGERFVAAAFSSDRDDGISLSIAQQIFSTIRFETAYYDEINKTISY